MTIIPLSEGSFTIDKTKLFVPYDETQHELQERPTGSLLVEVQPFVVVTPKDILLFDPGLGFTIDKTKLFVPYDETEHDVQERSAGSWLVEVHPFVVVTPMDILLFDTGLGFSNADGRLQVHQNLINAGIDPLHVTKVLLSHLH